jgi:type IV pilus assembly protein PilM
MPLLRKKPAFVGLSIHEDEIRLIKLHWIKRRLKINDAAILAIPRGLFIEGKVAERKRATSFIKELVDQTQSQGCETAIALPISDIMHKRIALDADLTDWERELEIADNLARYLPAMQSELHYDHLCLGRLDAKHDDVMLVAARSEQVNGFVSVVQEAGLKVAVVDADIYALTRCVLFTRDRACSAAVIAMDVHSSQLIVIQQKKIVFHRRVDTPSLEEITEDIATFARIQALYLSGKGHLVQLQARLQSRVSYRVEIFSFDHDVSWPEGAAEPALFLTAFGLAARFLR